MASSMSTPMASQQPCYVCSQILGQLLRTLPPNCVNLELPTNMTDWTVEEKIASCMVRSTGRFPRLQHVKLRIETRSAYVCAREQIVQAYYSKALGALSDSTISCLPIAETVALSIAPLLECSSAYTDTLHAIATEEYEGLLSTTRRLEFLCLARNQAYFLKLQCMYSSLFSITEFVFFVQVVNSGSGE